MSRKVPEGNKSPTMPLDSEDRGLLMMAPIQHGAAQVNSVPYLSALATTSVTSSRCSCSSGCCITRSVPVSKASPEAEAETEDTTVAAEAAGAERAAHIGDTVKDAAEYGALADAGSEAKLRQGLKPDFHASYGASMRIETEEIPDVAKKGSRNRYSDQRPSGGVQWIHHNSYCRLSHSSPSTDHRGGSQRGISRLNGDDQPAGFMRMQIRGLEMLA